MTIHNHTTLTQKKVFYQIEQIRISKNITQEKICAMAEISTPTYRSWKSCETSASFADMLRIFTILGVKIVYPELEEGETKLLKKKMERAAKRKSRTK